jgi:metallo-beta-lactamase family protein
VKERLPIRHNLFLVHGEQQSLAGMRARASALMPAESVIVPALDDGFDLTARGARSRNHPRHPGSSPDASDTLTRTTSFLSKLILDIGDTLNLAPDERAKGVVIRRLRRALEKTSA